MRSAVSPDLAQARHDTDTAIGALNAHPHDADQLRTVDTALRLLQIERAMADSELPQMIEQMIASIGQMSGALSVNAGMRADLHTDIYLNICRCALLMGNSLGAMIEMLDALRQRDAFRQSDDSRQEAEDSGAIQRASAFADALSDIDRANWGEGPLYKGTEEWTFASVCQHAERVLMRYGLETEAERRRRKGEA